jgi:GT2 family glycosyltransferase
VDRTPATDLAVSVVIPTIGSSGSVGGVERVMVVDTIRSVIDRTTQRDLEFVVVFDSPTPPAVLEELRKLDQARPGVSVRLVEFSDPFNFSAKCNIGALHASHDVLVFLNDDMEAVSEEVIGQLVAPLFEQGVGVTGAKLLFESGQIQHGGVQYGSGTVYPSFYKESGESCGPQGDLSVNREVTALTGACLAVTRETFERVGGFNESLPINFNDVDFCLKVRFVGLRALWLHDVVLYHFESISRSPEVRPWEFDALIERWGDFRVVRERYTSGVR